MPAEHRPSGLPADLMRRVREKLRIWTGMGLNEAKARFCKIAALLIGRQISIQDARYRMIRFSLGFRIYGIVGPSFCGLVGLAAMQTGGLENSMKQPRKDELAHLAQVALSIVREEYDAAQRDHSPDDLARKAAAARIGALRYGNGDYFWINDLGPSMIMHPVKPELNGQDLSETKDPSGKRLFVEFAETVRKQGSGTVEYQ
jgi:methyl-accepting chemotaxis protein